MSRSRTISISVKKKTGDTFDAILNIPPKMMQDAKIDDNGWWSFTGLPGKSYLKFNEYKPHGILDHKFIDEKSTWHVPMRVMPSGDYSKILITLNKPDLTIDERIKKEKSIKIVSNLRFCVCIGHRLLPYLTNTKSHLQHVGPCTNQKSLDGNTIHRQ